MERIKEWNMIKFIKNADAVIQKNPRILEEEQFPNVKEVYREHYRRKRAKQSHIS